MNRELTDKNPRRISKPKHGIHYSNIPVSLDAKRIPDNDPWRDDLYKRKEYADQLYN